MSDIFNSSNLIPKASMARITSFISLLVLVSINSKIAFQQTNHLSVNILQTNPLHSIWALYFWANIYNFLELKEFILRKM